MKSKKELALIALFEQWSGEQVVNVKKLPPSGSDREYYRLQSDKKTAIGVYNSDRKENKAFLSFTKHFRSLNLPVPQIFAENEDEDVYIQSDLGDITLFSYVELVRKSEAFPSELTEIYRKVVAKLPYFQIVGGKNLDYSVCYPRNAFDKQSMMWDLNYFKYYFLKLARIPFNEQDLEKDFHTFTDFLLEADCSYFLYRDFQTRNVMLTNGEPFFIDYQGGRKGALQYDLASLLYQAKTAIPHDVRMELVEHYLSTAEKLITIDRKKFMEHFFGYVVIRMLQAMGAYGFRGFYERKKHFLSSIPFVVKSIGWINDNVDFPVEIPALKEVMRQISQSEELKSFESKKDVPNNLNVKIMSFSYKQGLPQDNSGNGGGYIFDCRGLHNPGRYDEYKTLSGKDEKVAAFFAREKEIYQFLDNVYSLVDQSVEKYMDRGFTSLMVNFGCTGGQHRSVFCAEMLSKHLNEKYNVSISLQHRELERGILDNVQ